MSSLLSLIFFPLLEFGSERFIVFRMQLSKNIFRFDLAPGKREITKEDKRGCIVAAAKNRKVYSGIGRQLLRGRGGGGGGGGGEEEGRRKKRKEGKLRLQPGSLAPSSLGEYVMNLANAPVCGRSEVKLAQSNRGAREVRGGGEGEVPVEFDGARHEGAAPARCRRNDGRRFFRYCGYINVADRRAKESCATKGLSGAITRSAFIVRLLHECNKKKEEEEKTERKRGAFFFPLLAAPGLSKARFAARTEGWSKCSRIKRNFFPFSGVRTLDWDKTL